MLFPNTRFIKQDNAAQRKIVPPEAKAIHDSCVDSNGLPGIGVRRNHSRVFTREYLKCEVGRCGAKRCERFDIPAYDPIPDVGIIGPIDWSRRDAGDFLGYVPWYKELAFSVNLESQKDNNGISGYS